MARWREGAGAHRRAARVQRRYERTLAALERRGKPRAAPCSTPTSALAERAHPVRDLERHRAGPPDALDGDRAPARSRARAAVRHALGGRAGGPRAGLPGRVHGLLRDPGRGQRLALVAAPAGAPARGDRGGRARRRRLRRRPPLPGADRRAGGRARHAARSGAGGRCGSPARTAARSSAQRFFDAVLEPGEFAERRGPRADRGAPARQAHGSAPIVFCDDAELLPRADAERELGLEPGKVNDPGPARPGRRGAPARRRAAWTTSRAGTASRSPRSPRRSPRLLDVPEGVVHLRSTYPMSRYFARLRRWRSRRPATTPSTS